MDGKDAMVAEQPDVRSLIEQIKQMRDDLRAFRSDAAEVRASSARVRSGLASIRADVARVEMKLDAFQEAVDDRFDHLDDLPKSFSHDPSAEQLGGSEDQYANDRSRRRREDRDVLE
jgi:septal ring factor EnvC (AmiA/AmiB activator)